MGLILFVGMRCLMRKMNERKGREKTGVLEAKEGCACVHMLGLSNVVLIHLKLRIKQRVIRIGLIMSGLNIE
jgi:hypothetical protein